MWSAEIGSKLTIKVGYLMWDWLRDCDGTVNDYNALLYQKTSYLS